MQESDLNSSKSNMVQEVWIIKEWKKKCPAIIEIPKCNNINLWQKMGNQLTLHAVRKCSSNKNNGKQTHMTRWQAVTNEFLACFVKH